MKFKFYLIFSVLVAAFFWTARSFAVQPVNVKQHAAVHSQKSVETVNVDFSHPTDLQDIAKKFTLLTGKSYEVDPSIQTKVRLISPDDVSKVEALRRFNRMLSQYDLTTVEAGGVTKIVSAR